MFDALCSSLPFEEFTNEVRVEVVAVLNEEGEVLVRLRTLLVAGQVRRQEKSVGMGVNVDTLAPREGVEVKSRGRVFIDLGRKRMKVSIEARPRRPVRE